MNESAPLLANEINPGEIAKYLWEVTPLGVCRVVDPTSPSTQLVGLTEGEVKVQLTASDGLYKVVSHCTTRVSGVAEPPDNENDNDDDNVNENDNTPDNANDNDNANTNDNADNTNDNDDKPDRPGGVRKDTATGRRSHEATKGRSVTRP